MRLYGFLNFRNKPMNEKYRKTDQFKIWAKFQMYIVQYFMNYFSSMPSYKSIQLCIRFMYMYFHITFI